MACHVVIPDNVDQAALDVLAQAGGLTVTAPGKMARAAVLAAVPQADALIIRSGTTVDAEMLAAAPLLKAVARAGVGVDNVDLAEATRRGVVVMNTPGGNTVSTAEHAFALMLALVRHIPAAHQSLKDGQWDRKAFAGSELRGKTLGIVGFGRIGQAIARRAVAFEMAVIAFEPYANEQTYRVRDELGVKLVDLDTLYARADIITLHPALTDETRGMINAQSIARMKPGVRLINAARGGLIAAADLAEAIRRGQVAGVALDVYEPEPPSADYPLLGLPEVVHTPHLAASTPEAQVEVGVEAAHLIVDALLHSRYANVVNPEALPSKQA